MPLWHIAATKFAEFKKILKFLADLYMAGTKMKPIRK
jgi:hypothetical protein